MTDTDIVQYERPADSQLEQWARDLSQAYNAAVRLVTTAFVPDSYKGKAADAAAAIMTGAEIGLSPLASLRSIDIIHGTPAMRAVMLRGLAQSAGHEVWVEESTATRAIVCGRRKGSDHVERVVWTIERARQMKLTGKDNWQRMPQDMLVARGSSAVVRLIAADLIMGIPYSVEELEDDGDAPAEITSTPPRPARRTVKRAALRVAEPEPEQPAALEAAEPDAVIETPMALDQDADWEEKERAEYAEWIAAQEAAGEEPPLDGEAAS